MRRAVWCCVVLLSLATVMQAQWLNYKTPGVPRTPDGQPKLDAPPPLASDGRPDLTGVWMHDLTPIDELRRLFGPAVDEEIKNELPGMEVRNIHKYVVSVLADFTRDNTPARPEAIKATEQTLARRRPGCPMSDTPTMFPLPGLLAEPIKIVQAPRVTMVLYEVGGNFRQIYTDGRTFPAEFNLPAYFGYSVGHWDRDTFVIESAGFNEKTTLDRVGHPHSDHLRIVERFRRRDFGHLETEMTYDDPTWYTRPFTITISYHLLADQDIFEMFSENEKDCAHLGKAPTN
jgi:hypothetical protein